MTRLRVFNKLIREIITGSKAIAWKLKQLVNGGEQIGDSNLHEQCSKDTNLLET